VSQCGTLTRSPIIIATGHSCGGGIGLLQSFAFRWRDDPSACALVPFVRFVTGRIPNIEEYPFPYMALVIPGGQGHGRSDRSTWARRTAVIHTWVDMDKLELGEAIAEKQRQIYCNQSWRYDYGDIIDVLDHGPPQIISVNEPTFQYHELVKTMTLCIQQARVDSCSEACATSCDSGCDSGS